MRKTDPLPANEHLRATRKAGRLAYLFESTAIVLLAALAAYAASS